MPSYHRAQTCDSVSSQWNNPPDSGSTNTTTVWVLLFLLKPVPLFNSEEVDKTVTRIVRVSLL